MSCNWPLSTLGDFVSLFTGFPFKSKQFSDVEGTKLLRGDNVAQGTLRWENVKRWTDENLVDKHKNYLLRESDVILAMDRPWIEAGLKFSQIESRDLPCYLVQRVACLRANDPDDQDFLKFIIGSRAFTEYVKLVQTGTAVPHISGKQILAFEFRLPPKDIRLSIGKTLSDIDRKVSINTQTNQTLEQIAQAIFKSWFVDFDPVKAKMKGEQPEGMDAATASLFPEKLVESELGLIPEGWELKKIGDVVERYSVGKKYSQKTAVETGLVPILDQGKSGIIGYHNDSPGVKASLDDPIIVFANHTCYMKLVTYDFSAIQNVLPFKLNGCDIYWSYLATQGRQSFVEYKGHWPDFMIHEIVIPSETLMQRFGDIVKPLYSQMASNENQNKSLAKLRDTLLPKLLSGEIELGQAQELAEVE
ncbi:restriction endonuclease subunit S [Vibrio metschnikovii]|nr:restriction endonuclease subunit S [Vibrio metschnikovii]